MNNISIIGNITKDIETKAVGQFSAAEFSIAVNKVFYDAQKVKQERVSYFDCVAWGRDAENVAKWFGKGKPIAIIGELEQDRWEKDGEKRSKVRIRVNGWDFCGGNDKTSGESRPKSEPKKDELDPAQEDDIPY